MSLEKRKVQVPKKLLDRLRADGKERAKLHRHAARWDGEYGYGAGRAHPSVEFATCPVCGSKPGFLCLSSRGPGLSRHYERANAYREMLREARRQLARETWGPRVD